MGREVSKPLSSKFCNNITGECDILFKRICPNECALFEPVTTTKPPAPLKPREEPVKPNPHRNPSPTPRPRDAENNPGPRDDQGLPSEDDSGTPDVPDVDLVGTAGQLCTKYRHVILHRVSDAKFGLRLKCNSKQSLEACFYKKGSHQEMCKETYLHLSEYRLGDDGSFRIPVVAAYDMERVKEAYLMGKLTLDGSLERDEVTFEDSGPAGKTTKAYSVDRVVKDADLPPEETHVSTGICRFVKGRCAAFMLGECPIECKRTQASKDAARSAKDLCRTSQHINMRKAGDSRYLMYLACHDMAGTNVDFCFYNEDNPGLSNCRSAIMHLAAVPLGNEGDFTIAITTAHQAGVLSILNGALDTKGEIKNGELTIHELSSVAGAPDDVASTTVYHVEGAPL